MAKARRNRKVTLQAVADAAGVSTATVDRVLNARLPVREATALRVIAAAERIGYHGAQLMRQRLPDRQVVRRLAFCLQKHDDPFYQSLGEAITDAAAQHRPEACHAQLHFMDALDPASIAEALLQAADGADALAVVALDHPRVCAAVDALHAEGKPVLALLSDLSTPLRLGYAGIDNRQRGRTAAWAMRRLARRKGVVGVFVGSHRYLGQEANEMSFRAALREAAPGLRVLESLVNLEDAQLAHEATLELLARHKDLVGLYAAGGGAAGIVAALREEGLGRGIVTICHELIPEHREALIDGVVDLVLHTPPEALARTAVRVLCQALATRDVTPGARQPQSFVLPFEIRTPENA